MPVRFQYSSDQSLIVYLGDTIGIETHRRVVKLLYMLQFRPISGVRNLHPAYCSLLVVFDPLLQDHKTIESVLRDYIDDFDTLSLPGARVVEIPVCYGNEFGPDLPEVAALHGISPQRVVELHSQAEYLVYFLGFVPGFAYLGGLPSEIATPRLATPRKRVPAGSVAIGGDQTGIYPLETPGGWRLIGATPLTILLPEHPEMSRLNIGDIVRFKSISRDEFSAWKAQCR